MDTSSHPTARWSMLGVVLVSLVGLRLHDGGRTTTHDVVDVRSRTVRTIVRVPVYEASPSGRSPIANPIVAASGHRTPAPATTSTVADHHQYRSGEHPSSATAPTTTTTTTTAPTAAVPAVNASGTPTSTTPAKVLKGWVAAPDDAVALYPLSPTATTVRVELQLQGTATATLTCGSATTSMSTPSATLELPASSSCTLELSTNATTSTSFTAAVTGATW